MIKIAEIWGLGFDRVANELSQSVENVNGIVLDFLSEIRYKLEHPSYYKILEIAKQHNIPIVILTPYLSEMPPLLDFDNNIRIIHWETFWFNRTYEAWKPHNELNKTKHLEIFNLRNGEHLTDFKYPYITLNNIAKHHRCLVMDLLAKYNLIDKGAIAWRDIRRDCDDIRHTFPEGVTDSVYFNYPYQYWKPRRMILDQGINDKFFQETMPIEFTESFMQLVTESDDEVIFFSEKTATPILLNKLFLIAGAKGYHTALKIRGFELYDEIFDYSFDNESDGRLRCKGLIENVNRISSLPKTELEKLHKSLFDKLVYNKQHAMNLINTIPSEVTEVLEWIKKRKSRTLFGPTKYVAMILDWKKYKRFFTFGCSFTCYMWPTWADVISKEMPDAEFNNFGISGAGNTLISYRIAEANNRFKFTDTDLVMVMFTSYCREDRWTTERGWIAGGNIFNNRYYPDSWVKEFADERGYLIRDAAVIDMTMKYLDNVPATSYCMLSVPFTTSSENPSLGAVPYDIRAIYENTLNRFGPSMYELEMRNNWKELEDDYPFDDGHPAPKRYYNYMKKLGLNLSDASETYATEMSDLLKTIQNRQIVPIYFPEQDANVSKSIRVLF